MNKTILAFIFSLFSLVSFSQKVSVKWGGELATKSGQMGNGGEYYDGVYTYNIESFRGKSTVTVIDKNKKATKQEVVDNGEYYIRVEHIFTSPKGTYLIIRGLTKKTTKAMIGYAKVTNGIIDKEIKELKTYDFDGGNYGDNSMILQSNDGSKLAIGYKPASKVNAGFNFIVINENMEIIQKINKSSSSNIETSDYDFDNNGNLSVWCKKGATSEKGKSTISLINFTPERQNKDISIKLPNAYIEDFSVSIFDNGKKIIVGTYYNTDNIERGGTYGYAMGKRIGFIGGVNGVFSILIDTSGSSSSPKLYPFSEESILKFDVQKKHLDKGIPMVSFEVFTNKFDNSVSVFLEETNKSSTTTTFNAYTPYNRSSTSITYYTNTILVNKINSTGELQYSTVIDKKCKYGEMLDYGSYYPFFKEDNLYVLYNKSLYYEDKKKDIDEKGAILSELVKINNSGTIVSSEILFGNKDVDIILTPNDCSKIDDNKIKLVGMDRKTIKYGTLEVK
jgi:hypothetical protein